MHAQDEDDFVFICLLGAYIQSLRKQEKDQQQHLQRGKAGFYLLSQNVHAL